MSAHARALEQAAMCRRSAMLVPRRLRDQSIYEALKWLRYAAAIRKTAGNK